MNDDQPELAPAAPEPARKFIYKTVSPWLLTGPDRSLNLDQIVKFSVVVGLGVTRVSAGAYRLTGPLEAIQSVEAWIEEYKPAGPIVLGIEGAPETTTLRFEVIPDRSPPRRATIHGQTQPERVVARAIDAGLIVTRLGIERYDVRGQTRQHLAWLMDLFEVPLARALEILNLTPEQAAAEDAAAPLPVINVALPTREIVSAIARDQDGNITSVKQTERTVK